MIALVFGSRDWHAPEPIDSFLAALAPSLLVHGACGLDEGDPIDPDRMRGADGHAHRAAAARGIPIAPHPAAWKRLGKAAGMRRNAEMPQRHRIHVAAGWITGKVGAPMSPGSAGMARICQRSLPGVAPIPVVVFREGGAVELPARPDAPLAEHLGCALAQVRGLYRTTPAVEPAGKALRAAWEAERGGAPMADVQAMLRGALGEVEKLVVEQPRIAPWLGVVVGLLKRW